MKKDTEKSSLLNRWKNRPQKKELSKLIAKAPIGVNIPLSHGQKRLWFLQQLYPKNAFYNYAETYTFNGKLNDEILIESLKRVYKDHDILRTTYHIKNGEIFQRVNSNTDIEISKHDLSTLSQHNAQLESKKLIEANASKHFDLAEGPLIRIELIKLNSLINILQITLHHIITDKWSMGKFREDLAGYYRDINSKEAVRKRRGNLQYSDYAFWQNKQEINSDGLKYWKNKLSGELPFLNLPIDYKRPLQPTFKGAASFTQTYSKDVSKKLLALSKELETTPYVLMLSIYYVLLQRISRQTDILIGSPVTNRDQKILENLIGFFNETIILRTNVPSNARFKDLVKEVQTNTVEAFENKNIPFDLLVKELKVKRSLAVNPFFQVMFLYHAIPETPLFDTEVNLSHAWHDLKVSKFDLTLYIAEDNGILSSTFEYASDLFEESTVNRFQVYFKALIEGVILDPSKSISELPMLSAAEKQLITINKKTYSNNFLGYTGIHNIIETIAENYPNNIALTFGEYSISYKELNEKANQIAKELLKDSTKKNTIVGLSIERSVDMIIGLLGILKAGCAYLPIDPEYPHERIYFILKDAKVDTIITQTSLLNIFEKSEVHSILIDDINFTENDSDLELPTVKDSDLAYVIYTSGSTGQPKGVQITHQNIINSTSGRLDFYTNNPSVFLLMSSISFDSSKAGIFWTLCTGGNLVITEKRIEQDIIKIADTIAQNKVSHTLMLPSLYKVILENVETRKIRSLTTVIVAGETCSKSLCAIHFQTLPNVSIYNEYGPTEATVWCIAHKIEAKDIKQSQIPIGKPIANAEIYLLDKQLNLVPFGTSGEIYIGGTGLTKGYINRPDHNSKSFLQNPFKPDKKLYKTGDLAKYRTDGVIEFLGRTDQQIKIRGYRVELDDIENTIIKNSSIQASVVLVQQKEDKPKRLSAYIKADITYNENELKKFLKAHLPIYMIPSEFVLINTIPLLPNGKVDRKTLGSIKALSNQNNLTSSEPPKNLIESRLLDIWKSILNLDMLSTTDNFFEIGGDSILSIQIIAQARREGIYIAPNQIFEYQTISELALFVSAPKDEMLTNAETLILGEVPLMPIQKWFFQTHREAPEYWNQGYQIKNVPETLNSNVLLTITNHLIQLHDALRLSFYLDNEEWKAKVLKPDEIDAFIKVDMSKETASNYNVKIENTLKLIQEDTKLKNGNLFKCIYFETGDGSTNSIILLAHHLVVDFVSWQIILNSYTELIDSGKLNLQDAKTASIKTWGNHILERANSEKLTNNIKFWKDQIEPETSVPLDFNDNFPLLEKDISTIHFEIDKTATDNLITKANNTYNTKIEELVLTALVETISQWTNDSNVTLAMERHGRETSETSIDLSNTVGWFTSFFPLSLNFNSTSEIADKIISIKEQIRQIPNGGIGYGILRYLTPNFGEVDYPKIVFNYLGKQSAEEKQIEFLSKNVRHPLSERHYYLEINALIKDGILGLDWSYSKKIHKRETIEALIKNFNACLKSILEHCIQTEHRKYTPSDFDAVDLDQEELDSLMDNLDF